MKQNRKGFTLAELLIVVAIIAVLVAVAIPVFSAQLEKSREATDVANIRSAYAEIVTKYLENPSTAVTPITVKVQQRVTGCQTDPAPSLTYQGNGEQADFDLGPVLEAATAADNQTYTVTLDVDTTTGVVYPMVDGVSAKPTTP